MFSKLKQRIKLKIRSQFGFYGRCFWFFWLYASRLKVFQAKYHSESVLILRLDLLGDCAMFTSTLDKICDIYEDKKIDIVCLTSTKPIFERLGRFNKIITVDFQPHCINFSKLKKLLKEIRKNEYDTLLQPQISRLPLADIIAAATRCNKRLAISAKPGNSSHRWIKMVSFIYDKLFPYPEGWKSEFDYYASFIHGLGFKKFKSIKPKLCYKKQEWVHSKYYILYPGASYLQRAWEPYKFAKLIDYIYQKTGLTAVILGVQKEKILADKIRESTSLLPSFNIVDLTGKTSVGDVIDLIGNAEFVISNDTSGVHLACATNTPSIVLVGGGHFDRFLPYHIQKISPSDNLPDVVAKKMDCYYCDWNWSIIAQRNPECLELMKKGVAVKCIQNISVEDLLPHLDALLIKNKFC